MTTAKTTQSTPAASKPEAKAEAAAPAPAQAQAPAATAARKPAAKPATAPKADASVIAVELPKAPSATEAAEAAAKQAAEAAKVIDEAVAVGKQTVENVVKAGTDTATKTYEKAVAVQRSRVDAVGKVSDDAMKTYETSVAVAKENVDAMLTAGSILVKGAQDITKIMLSAVHDQLEENLAYGKALAGCRSMHEVIELNQSTLKAGADNANEVGTKISATSAKVLEQAVGPLADRLTANIERALQPMGR